MSNAGSAANENKIDAMTTAKQQIIELRMRYAQATDAIASGKEAGINAGRETYQQIYTSDASISADGIKAVTGPEAWVKVVSDALESFVATQHHIGSPLVHSITLPDAAGKGGEAQLSSYLQAWHSSADNTLYMYFGTYHDTCVYSLEHGWQIAKMHLEKTADEQRTITPRE